MEIRLLNDNADGVRIPVCGFASAKNGKRIGRMKLISAKGSNKKSSWNYELPFRDVGPGKKKQVTLSYKPAISTSTVSWT